MSRNISVAMRAHLALPVVTLTTLFRIDRVDGITLGFTPWDVPIEYDGVTYQPGVSMSPSGVKTNIDLTTDQMDIIAAIDSDYITEPDIDSGRYDLGSIEIFRVNPYDLTMGPLVDLTGYIDSVEYGDGQLTVQIVSLGQKLNQTFGDVVTPVCRVRQLGDAQCKINIATFTFSGVVASFSGSSTITFSDVHATGYYDYGMIIWDTVLGGGGANNNLKMEIKTSTQLGANVMQLLFQEVMPFSIQVGDSFTIQAGCNRTPLTCRSKFNNLVNIHCEPYVPGNDYLLSTGRPPG